MKKLFKKITHPFYKKYHFWYHKKPRKYRYKNVYTIVQPTVFSPKNTISTKVFLDYIDALILQNKTALELGCGSGIISIFTSSKNAKTTATDINKIAIDSLKKVGLAQGFNIKTIESNLFDKIPKQSFDYIFINPPYYPKKPTNIEEKAWFCGENFEYFEQLFKQLNENLSKNTLMILSDDCELEKIQEIAKKNKLAIHCIFTKKLVTEKNFIYSIKRDNA